MRTGLERRWASALTLGGILLGSAALCLPANAEEATETPRALRIDEALAYARAHQPAIQAARARIAAAQADAGVPRSQWLPQIGVTAQIFGGTANNTTASYASVGSL